MLVSAPAKAVMALGDYESYIFVNVGVVAEKLDVDLVLFDGHQRISVRRSHEGAGPNRPPAGANRGRSRNERCFAWLMMYFSKKRDNRSCSGSSLRRGNFNTTGPYLIQGQVQDSEGQ